MKIVATKPNDILKKYLYIWKQWLKKPTGYIFIQIIKQGTILENLNA